MSSRNRELFNLAFGALIAAAAFASVSIALSDEVSAESLTAVGVFALLFLAAHPPRIRRCYRSPASSVRSV